MVVQDVRKFVRQKPICPAATRRERARVLGLPRVTLRAGGDVASVGLSLT